jgi:glycosyltransferase involved in cell wall biosynthesis
MSSIKLAIIFDQPIRGGGGFQQAINAALLALKLPAATAKTIFYTTLKENVTTLSEYGINAEYLKYSFFDKIDSYFRSIYNPLFSKFFRFFLPYTSFERHLLDCNVDLVYFLSPTSMANNLEKINYITTVWDLSHRDDPEFPEVRWSRQFEIRDNNYKSILPRAVAVLVDSDLGKTNLCNRYCIDQERVYVMPFEASVFSKKSSINIVNVKNIYSIEYDYIYYPAQFWPHKNHVYILDGLRLLEHHYSIKLNVIFSGADYGNEDHVKKHAHLLGLEDRVIFTGFVDLGVMPQLYKQSVAMVMPTYFGPTNLPPLEAFQLGVPVLYSDLPGLRDQVGDAALLMDLNNPMSMALHLYNLVTDGQLRNNMIMAGENRINYLASIDRVSILMDIINKFSHKRRCWPRSM